MAVKRIDLAKTKNAMLEVENGTAAELSRQRSVWKRKNTFRLSYWDRRKLKRAPEFSYLITMMFPNGTCKTFVIKTQKSHFTMQGKTYALVAEECFFDITMNQMHLFYNSEFAIPINREIYCEKDEKEAYYQVKPNALKDIFDFEFIKFAVKGQGLVAWQKWLIGAGVFIVVIFIVIVVINRMSQGG